MAKTVLITGASSGIGKATAKYFQDKGWNVIATMRTPDKEEELTQLDNVLVTKLDVTQPDSILSALKTGIDTFGKIDVLVNNAGYGSYGPLEVLARENIERQFNTNVIGLLDVSRAIIPHFRSKKDGVLINVSSVAGRMAFPFGVLYHGTKFAVEGISESLNFELETIGCKVKIIEPGAIATDFGGRSFEFQNNESIEEYQPMIRALFAALEPVFANAAPASLAAEVIYTAATDGSDQLRYHVGDDAVQLLEARRSLDDRALKEMIIQQFGF